MQLSIFDSKTDFKFTKTIRLISLFSGYDSQLLALKYLGANVESWKTCEWAVKSIQALKDLHFCDDNTDYSKDLTKEELIEFLYKKGISSNYNEPMTEQQIKRLSEVKLRNIYNNIKATHNMVNIQQVHGKDLEIKDVDKFEYLVTYSYPCITEDSLILTKDGYKEYRELSVGDYVLTKSNTWQKIAKKFDNGVHKTYYLQGMGFENIHCTANHKFYVREKYRNGHKGIRCFKEPVFKEVKDITRNDYFGVPVIQEETPFYKDDLDFWYMIGYYLGDGWLSSSGNDIILACNDTKLEKLKSHLNINKWHYTYHWSGSCCRLRFANKEIYEFISKYIGTGCFEKRICGEILNLPKAQLSALIDGYIDSDGCRIKKNIQFSSVNRGLIYGVSSIINKVYHRTTCISKNIVNSKKNIQGRIVNQHDWYLLRFKPVDDIQDKAFYENGYLWYPFTKLVEAEEEHVYNMEIENDHSYIVQGCISKNCQDLSLAGKREGMKKGSGTRSGMLWEFERILDECNRGGYLPNVCVMENVPQVHGKKNLEDFNMWINKLESLGYKNYWKDLNAKCYGIPQNRNRCFMVSVLGDYNFTFPEPTELKLRLTDLLEDVVDEKYYLSDSMVEYIQSTNNKWTGNNGNNSIINREIACTKTTREGNTRCDASDYVCKDLPQNFVFNKYKEWIQEKGYFPNKFNPYNKIEIKNITPTQTRQCGSTTSSSAVLIKEGNLVESIPKTKLKNINETLEKNIDKLQDEAFVDGYNRNIKTDGICGTITTRVDASNNTAIIKEENLKSQLCNKLIENNMVEEGDAIRHSYTQNRLKNGEKNMGRIENHEKISPTLDTRCDCLGVCVKDSMYSETEKQLFTEDGNIKRYINIDVIDEFKEGQMATTSFPNGYGHGHRTHDESMALNTIDKPSVKKNLRIRKLLPLECFRLQGVKDKDFEKIAKNQSDASLFHLSGDSICSVCLLAIFGQLLGLDYKNYIDFENWWHVNKKDGN